MKMIISMLSLLLLVGCDKSTPPQKTEKVATENATDWAMLDFVKADSINPILQPSASQIFTCPIGNKEVKWEERNVLNPSAVVNELCFVEGLVFFKNQWLLYYGTADSKIAVAVRK